MTYSDQEMIDRENGEYLDDLDKDERPQIDGIGMRGEAVID